MKASTMLKICFAGVMLVILGVSTLVYRIDPYFYFNKPNENLKYAMAMNDFEFYNAGIAKNFDYDTIILGSSMTRAFLPSYVDEVMNCKSVKLSMASARGKDFSTLLPLVIKNENLKTVIFGLDSFAFNVDVEYTDIELPTFMYESGLHNTMQYLYNIDRVLKCIDIYRDTKNNVSSTTMDDYQNYALNSSNFSKEKVIEIYKRKNVKKVKDEPFDLIKQRVENNLNENIIPFIEARQDVKFKFFMPPYPIINWSITPNLKNEISSVYFIINRLIDLPNVEIYYPQAEMDIITNLDHYMDTKHYDTVITKEIVDYINNDQNRISRDNLIATLEGFYDTMDTYDFSIY